MTPSRSDRPPRPLHGNHLDHIAAAGPELHMIQANPSYRFTNERPQRTSHKYGSHSVTLLALEPVAAPRHISDQT